jgi:hypothetical protein
VFPGLIVRKRQKTGVTVRELQTLLYFQALTYLAKQPTLSDGVGLLCKSNDSSIVVLVVEFWDPAG